LKHGVARRMRAADDGEHGWQRGAERGLLSGQRGEQILDRGAVVQADRQQRRVSEAAQTGTESYTDAHHRHNRYMADSLRGKLILASPVLRDPNFVRTVVLIAEHTDEGAMGLVLNRPAAATVGEAVPDLSWLAGDEEPVYVGGPVAETAVIVLAEFDRPELAGALVEDDLGFIGADADEPDRLDGAIRRARVFAGHAGWGPGQLEDELGEEAWIVEAPLREEIFTIDPEDLWAAVLRRKGNRYALLATMPLDPSVN
jgi:putative transcriptional regulator